MNLKISLFNKSVIKSDFKRFWWISVLSTLAIFLFFTFIYLNDAAHMVPSTGEYIASNIARNGLPSMGSIFVFPVVMAALLFSYLNSSGAVTSMHGLPIKRGTFFASHILSGSIILAVPVIVNMLIMLIARVDPAVAASYKTVEIFIWAGLYLLYTILVFNAASAVAMLTGNSVASIVFTYIFAGLPVMAENFIKYFCAQQIYGYVSGSDELITGFLYVLPWDMCVHPLNILKYIIFAALFLAAAYWLYRIRKLENNGEVVAFAKLRPVFIYGVAICAGAVGYLYFNNMWGTRSILFLIPFGLIGITAAEMIVKKSLKVKSAIKPAIIFCIAVCILQLGFRLDITGYERRIPAIESIATVSFENGINATSVEYTADGKRIYYDNVDHTIKDTKTIDAVVRLHEKLVKERKYDGKGNMMSFTLKYNLKNGKKITRAYSASFTEDEEYLKPIIESSEMRKVYFPILNDAPKKLISVEVRDDRVIDSGNLQFFENNAEEMNKLVEALKKDTAAAGYDEFAMREPTLTKIEISYTRPAHYESGKEVEEEKLPTQHETYYVRKSYENVKAVLAEMGFYDAVPKAEEIEYIGINYFGEMAEAEYTSDYSKQYVDDYSKIVRDPEGIRTAYKYLSENASRYRTNAEASIVLKNGNIFTINYDAQANDVPPELR